MGRTTEIAEHTFLPNDRPTNNRARYLARFLKSEDVGTWAEVYCVHFGEVDWRDCGNWNRRLYGTKEVLASLGRKTGFLVRTIYQFHCDEDEQTRKDQAESREDYCLLVQRLI